MDTLPSKRRKLLPTATNALVASQEQSAGEQITPNRASYLSPTKASLSRFNPSLLPRPKSAGEGAQSPHEQIKSASQHDVQSEQPRPFEALHPSPLRPATVTRGPGINAHPRAFSASPERRLPSFAVGINALPRRKSCTPGRATSPAKLLVSSADPGPLQSLAQVAQTTERDAQYRASKQLEIELRATSATCPERAAAANPVPRTLIEDNEGEPPLPLTPTQLGLEEAPKPPRGLQYSSPLRKAAKRTSSGLRSSPLKPRDATPEMPGAAPTKAPRNSALSIDVGEHENTNYQGGIRKEIELEKLLLQLKGLQNDIGQLEYELGQPGASSQEEVDDLVLIVTSANPTHLPMTRQELATPMSSRLALFLPFSKIPVLPKATSSTTRQPVPSHCPIRLGNPLTHLRAFTPLTIDSVETLVPSSATDSLPLKKHDITLRSPQNVLKVEIRLGVDPEAESVETLSLNHISPWADPELGTWIQKHVSKCDISTIGWACGRYWEVASVRGLCWYRCYENFGDLLSPLVGSDGVATSTNKAKAISSRRRGRPRNEETSPVRASIASNEGQEYEAEEQDVEISLSRSILRTHIGRTSLLFSRSGVSLLITWRIDFDWAGDVESELSASASYPKSWCSGDERACLDNVGRLFDRLVRRTGVYDALTAILALLFEE